MVKHGETILQDLSWYCNMCTFIKNLPNAIFFGVHCCFPLGSCWRKNKHLENKANKVEGDCIKAWSGVPKFGLRAIPIHIYTYIFNKIAILEGMSKCLHSVIPSF